MLVKVNYCYQCGRPVGSQAIKCLYCSAPTRRIIRPERRCPYCDEPIRHKAIKCVHCGEFLDGRPTEAKPLHAKNAQPTFIIEKAIISPQGLATPPRPSLPGADGHGRALPSPASTGRGPMQALPAPPDPEDEDEPLPTVGELPSAATLSGGFTRVDDDSVLDVEGRPSDSPAGGSGPPSSRELALRGAAAPSAPSVPAPPSGISAGSAVAPLPPVLAAVVRFFRRLFSARGGEADDAINIAHRSEEDNYRTCMMCQTEILAADNFCYHCGQQYSIKPFGWVAGSGRGDQVKSNAVLHVLTVLSLFAYALAENLIAGWRPEAVKPLLVAFAAAAPMLSFFAFMRKPGFGSRLLSFLFLIGSLGVIVYFLPQAFRSPG